MSLLPRQSIQFASSRPGAYPGLGPPLGLVSGKRWEPCKLWSDEVLLVTSRDGEMGALNPATGERPERAVCVHGCQYL